MECGGGLPAVRLESEATVESSGEPLQDLGVWVSAEKLMEEVTSTSRKAAEGVESSVEVHTPGGNRVSLSGIYKRA